MLLSDQLLHIRVLPQKPIIVVFAQIPSFSHYDIFTFQAQRLFKQAVINLSFLACNASHSKQTAVMFSLLLYFFRRFSLPTSNLVE